MDLQVFNAFYINIYAAVLLAVLLVILYIKRDVYDFSGRIYKNMIILNILLLVFEAFSLIVNNIDNNTYRIINYSLNFIVFLLTPLIGFLWAIYIDHKIFDKQNGKRQYLIFLSPFLLGAVLLFLNLFYPILFSISQNNVYSREPLIMVNFSTLFIIMLYVTYLVIANKSKMSKSTYIGVLLFLLFPVIGGILQMLYLGVATIYSTFSMGVFSTYIAFETIGTSRDNLTGLFTRKKASEYIKELKYKRVNFGVIMIDLDDFKELNDSYGHNEGDKFLIHFGEILMTTFNKASIVSRFGGDEFIIVKEEFVLEDLEFYKRAIYIELNKNSASNNLAEGFKFSIGCSVYNNGTIKTEEELVVEADNHMYLNKSDNKNYKRRKSDR